MSLNPTDAAFAHSRSPYYDDRQKGIDVRTYIATQIMASRMGADVAADRCDGVARNSVKAADALIEALNTYTYGKA